MVSNAMSGRADMSSKSGRFTQKCRVRTEERVTENRVGHVRDGAPLSRKRSGGRAFCAPEIRPCRVFMGMAWLVCITASATWPLIIMYE